jgi:rhodanese-related sulfurtransferase
MKTFASFALVLFTSCASRDARNVVTDFSPSYPKNYLIVGRGTPGEFREAQCFQLSDVRDANASFRADARLSRLLAERLPVLPPCEAGSGWPRLEISYQAGFGVCLHGCTPQDPRSAFAFITLDREPGEPAEERPAAEWQYWRGGSAEVVLQQFVFDLTNLYINGVVKPPPDPHQVSPRSSTTPLTAVSRPPSLFDAVLTESDAPTPNISTAELTEILARGNEVVLDTRPRAEWAISHIPSALNVAPKAGVPMSQYVSDVAEIERLVGGDRTRSLVLYCNGPFCGKSKRLSQELLSAGFTRVRRYQSGAPVWRALGGVMITELDGARHILENDRTAVWIDARAATDFATGSLGAARNVPRDKVLPGKDVGEVRVAKDDGRLPMEDHNTRIIVFGRDAEQARAVAEAIAREAFHNVSFFSGSYAELVAIERSRADSRH